MPDIDSPPAAAAAAAAEWLLVAGNDISPEISHQFALVQNGGFKELFDSAQTCQTIGANISDPANPSVKKLQADFDYAAFVEESIAAHHSVVAHSERSQWYLQLMCIGVGALRLFLQCNVTGPPLLYNPDTTLVPACLTDNADFVQSLSKAAVLSLTVDGESAYHLAAHPMLLVLAKTILNSPLLTSDEAPQTASWWRLRVNFTHQRVLSEKTGSLHKKLTSDIGDIATRTSGQSKIVQAMFLVERAMIDTYFGNDAAALQELEDASALTGLKYALTGVIGKRTRFQQNGTSQLVVLAKSAEQTDGARGLKPKTLDLNDDTLLESISFTRPHSTTPTENSDLPPGLSASDAGEQPPLHPLDATILLLIAEAIKNTNPEDGITREQMMPYAERVLSHSTNWEVYTLGLLVRSRIEGSKARTVERSVLQLQVIVDQVIAKATGSQSDGANADKEQTVPSFLPQPKEGESASISERLLYIHQLPIPSRWELEAELASRWASVGGLRTALEIYERLEMWPEVALCWAATGQEDKARKVIRDQLLEPITGQERTPPPPQAPRLWCVLGDIEEDPTHYEKAWAVSSNRYARAKRSLGRHYLAKGNYQKSSEAYGDSLRIYPLHGQSWFALGCCMLELKAWEGAVRAFRRAVNIDDTDAEAWSNLATALLRRGGVTAEENEQQSRRQIRLDDDDESDEPQQTAADPQKNRKDALRALRVACQLKRDSWRIWDNYLTVAASIYPPEFQDVVTAMKSVLELRKGTRGELAVDTDILERLVQHIITEDLRKVSPTGYDPSRPGLEKQVVELVEKDVIPLITTNPRLWKIVAKLHLWRKKPRAALEAHEKAWRAVNSRPGMTDATEREWDDLADATIELADAYESLGQMERTDGLGSGEMVAKDWKFKARSVVRGVMGRGKMNWEGTAGWDRLRSSLAGLGA
jgi:tetratricopeptide (TPR) repeat protein